MKNNFKITTEKYDQMQINLINEINKINIFQINFNKYIYFVANYKNNKKSIYDLIDIKQKNTINSNFFIPINLSNVKIILNQLNKILQEIFPNLLLDLDYLFTIKPPNQTIPITGAINPNNLVLCLYKFDDIELNGICISCIQIDNNFKHSIKISSYTHNQYESFKFNKLLRIVLILITPELKTCYQNKIKEIISVGINPVSVYLMINYFKAEPEKNFKDYIGKNKITIISYKSIENYFTIFKNCCGITTTIKINNNIIEYAKNMFIIVLEQIKNKLENK